MLAAMLYYSVSFKITFSLFQDVIIIVSVFLLLDSVYLFNKFPYLLNDFNQLYVTK
jgi:hypothetical protein